MSQLYRRSRKGIVAMAACLMLFVSVGCSAAVMGEPQSMLQNRVDLLHQRVDAATTPDAKHEAFWTTVCDTTREITSGRPAHINDWDRDLLAELYSEAVRVYWMQLADAEHSGKNGQFPLMKAIEDMANQLAGRETCDFRR